MEAKNNLINLENIKSHREYKIEITQDDVFWEMNWNNDKLFPDKPEKELMFEKENALAVLLFERVIFLNNYWWEKSWPDGAKKTTALCVNCNDIFAWGCVDAEEIFLNEIEDLYAHWLKDPIWGSSIWCIKKRGYMPQKPVYTDIQKAGIWDLDKMNLKPN